jgi:hypothetical protein
VARQADDEELEILRELLNEQRERMASGQLDIEPLIGTTETMYRQLTGRNPRDFAPWIVVCRAILNLDETITKE